MLRDMTLKRYEFIDVKRLTLQVRSHRCQQGKDISDKSLIGKQFYAHLLTVSTCIFTIFIKLVNLYMHICSHPQA